MEYWYIATPYTNYPLGRDMAFVDAARAVAQLSLSGVRCYSPITHSHPIAAYGNIDGASGKFWRDFDEPFLEGACGIIVVMMDGWDQSTGIRHEIDYMQQCGKPVIYWHPDTPVVLSKIIADAMNQ